MTAPMWMASPPEVHSALLSSGPGPGSLLAAAGAWTSLSAEYASAAGELTCAVGRGAGRGVGGSERGAVRGRARAVSGVVDAGQRQQRRAWLLSTRSPRRPTPPRWRRCRRLPELAANHAIHGVLMATNFFGINTIPIALNEADYVRMWIQAATTMGTYQAVSGTALASAPRTTAAPSGAQGRTTRRPAAAAPPSSGSNFLTELFNQLVADFFQNPARRSARFSPTRAPWPSRCCSSSPTRRSSPVGWTTWSLLLSAADLASDRNRLGINAPAAAGLAPVAVPAVGAPAAAAAGAKQSAARPVAALTATGGESARRGTGIHRTAPVLRPTAPATPATAGFAYRGRRHWSRRRAGAHVDRS